MIIEIVKVSWTGSLGCYNPNCQKLPEYIETIDGNGLWKPPQHFIKKDTVCASIAIINSRGRNTEYYCRGCIDWLYKEIKSKLCSELWPFQ